MNKKLTETNVWALAFGCIVGWGAFVMPGNTFLVKAGPLGTCIALIVAASIMILIAFNYSYMINKYPEAGGEFTYTQKNFGNIHAFICAWMLSLSYLAIVPLNATALALLGRKLLNNVFQVGLHYKVAEYDVYMGEVLLALSAIVFGGLLCIKNVKIMGKVQTILSLALILGVLIVLGAALLSKKVNIDNVYPLYNPNVNKLEGIMAVIAIAPWAFVGFDTIPQAAEEYAFSTRKTNFIMILSILFGAFVYIILNFISILVIPNEYISWVEYIDNLNNLEGIISVPTFNAAYELLGKVGIGFISISVLAAILSGIIGFYMATSRLLLSLSREYFLPKWFGKLHERYKTPINSIIFIMCISIVASFIGRTVLNWIVDMASVGAAIGYGYTSAATFKCAKEEKNILMMISAIMGTFFSVIFIIILMIPIPGLECSLNKESYFCLILWILAGTIFYRANKKNIS